MKKLFKKGEIERPEDLSPRGVRSTIKGAYSFNEVFDHIFNEARKPDLSWKNN